MTVWADLLAILRAENEILSSLLALSEEKQEKINDADEVIRIASDEQELVDRLAVVEQERAVLYDVIAAGRELEEWLASLSQEQQAEIGPIIVELAENLAALRSQNKLNQELLIQSLSYVQFSLNLLTGEEGPSTYAREGTGAARTSIFDRKV